MKIINSITRSAELICTVDQYEKIFIFEMENENESKFDLEITLCYDEIQDGGDKYLTAVKIYDKIYKKGDVNFISMTAIITKAMFEITGKDNIQSLAYDVILNTINEFIDKERLWE